MTSFLTARHAVTGAAIATAAGALLLLAIFAAVQTARIEGFHVWPVSVTGWKKTAFDREQERDAERAAHRETKGRIARAQIEAERLETERLARIRAEQEEISDAIRQDYTARLAAARARADRLRKDLQARNEPAAAPAGFAMPGLPPAAGGTGREAEDPRLPRAALDAAAELERNLTATEQALQLDALIDWVLRQAAIDPNNPEEIQP